MAIFNWESGRNSAPREKTLGFKQAGLSLTRSKGPEDGLSHDAAHKMFSLIVSVLITIYHIKFSEGIWTLNCRNSIFSSFFLL